MKLLSVAELAKKENISKPNIYAKLRNEWEKYCIIRDGIKYIDYDRLCEDRDKQKKDKPQQISMTLEEPSIKESQTPAQKETLTAEDKEQELTRTIEAQRAEIEELRKKLDEANENNRQIEHRLLDTLDRVVKLTENQQILAAKNLEQEQKLLEAANTRKHWYDIFFRKK